MMPPPCTPCMWTHTPQHHPKFLLFFLSTILRKCLRIGNSPPSNTNTYHTYTHEGDFVARSRPHTVYAHSHAHIHLRIYIHININSHEYIYIYIYIYIQPIHALLIENKGLRPLKKLQLYSFNDVDEAKKITRHYIY